MILGEPEIHLGTDILVPDLAGWRRDRLPEPPGAFTDVAPDWVCEVLSPSTERMDRGPKLAIYAREGVRHVWLINPETQTLEVFERLAERSTYALVAVHSGDARVRAVPFDSHEFDLTRLWTW